MAASKNTITDVYMVMRRHLSLSQQTKVINDLAEVKGNASFTTTVKLLKALHQRLLEATSLTDENEAKFMSSGRASPWDDGSGAR